MADIIFNCPYCTKSLAIDERGAGARVKCVDCGKAVVVPGLQEPVEPAKSAKRCPKCDRPIPTDIGCCLHCEKNQQQAQPRISGHTTVPRRCHKCGGILSIYENRCTRCQIPWTNPDTYPEIVPPPAMLGARYQESFSRAAPAQSPTASSSSGTGCLAEFGKLVLGTVGLVAMCVVLFALIYESAGCQAGERQVVVQLLEAMVAVDEGPRIRSLMDSRCPREVIVEAVGTDLTSFKKSEIRFVGDSSQVIIATGESIDTREYSVPVVAFFGDRNLPAIIYVSVAKDSGKVLWARMEL